MLCCVWFLCVSCAAWQTINTVQRCNFMLTIDGVFQINVRLVYTNNTYRLLCLMWLNFDGRTFSLCLAFINVTKRADSIRRRATNVSIAI